MNQRFEHCLYQAGLTAQGCWDEMDDYAKKGIEKFAELIIQECLLALEPNWYASEIEYNVEQRLYQRSANIIKRHFGVEDERKS